MRMRRMEAPLSIGDPVAGVFSKKKRGGTNPRSGKQERKKGS